MRNLAPRQTDSAGVCLFAVPRAEISTVIPLTPHGVLSSKSAMQAAVAQGQRFSADGTASWAGRSADHGVKAAVSLAVGEPGVCPPRQAAKGPDFLASREN